ncbi:MAG: CNNM domain-containing protein [Chitinivibrionales bacterium]|nr:CNNM domain-containing protein [Chitinivibrionales bacterium]
MLVTLFAIALAGIFIFAGSETGFVSWNRLKITYRATSGDPLARTALFLLDRKQALLSAILIGNNLCLVGATILFISLYNRFDATIPWINLHSIPFPESWFLAPFVLIFCEMVPKSLFRIYSFSFTMRMVPLLLVTYYVFRPLTWFIDLFNRFFAGKIPDEASFALKVREEMVALAKEGSKSGGVFNHANTFIENVLALKEKTVGDVLFPMHKIGQITDIRSSETVGDVLRRLSGTVDSVMLVRGDEGQSVQGTVALKDLFAVAADQKIQTLTKPLSLINVRRSLLGGFKDVINRNQWYYGAVDESGLVQGIFETKTVLGMFFKGFESDTGL